MLLVDRLISGGAAAETTMKRVASGVLAYMRHALDRRDMLSDRRALLPAPLRGDLNRRIAALAEDIADIAAGLKRPPAAGAYWGGGIGKTVLRESQFPPRTAHGW
jgi:hypothetical protein